MRRSLKSLLSARVPSMRMYAQSIANWVLPRAAQQHATPFNIKSPRRSNNAAFSQFHLSFIKDSIQLDVVEYTGRSRATGEAVLLPQLADRAYPLFVC